MGNCQVTCINKKGDHFEPHERIDHVGNQMQGWKVPKKDAIRHIEHGSHSYNTSVNRQRAGLIVAIHNGRKYLTTTADGYSFQQSVAPEGMHGLQALSLNRRISRETRVVFLS